MIFPNVPISAINVDRGFAIVYYPSYLSKMNSFWIIVRNNLKELKFPVTLVENVWSQIVFTWYKNETSETRVNGLLPADSDAVTTSLTPHGSEPVVKLEFSPLTDPFSSRVQAFEGGIDEYTFYRRSLHSEVMLDLYSKFCLSFIWIISGHFAHFGH